MNSGTLYSQMVHSNACMFEKSWFMLWLKCNFFGQIATSNQHSKLAFMVMMKKLNLVLSTCFEVIFIDFLWRSQNLRTLYATAIVCHLEIMSRHATRCLSISQLFQRVCRGRPGICCCCTKENMFLRIFLKVLKASLALRCCIACIELTSIHFLHFLP